MTSDVVIAGVGGQGVLSVAAIIARAARTEGLEVKQTEVHGMAQRGGAVQATLRISPQPIASELVPRHTAAMILGLEPVEALRYLEYLSPDGVLITAAEPVTNVTDYPRIDEVHEVVRRIGGHLVEALRLAKESGSPRAANVVMVGAASVYLPLAVAAFEAAVTQAFAAKGERVIGINLAAFRAGRTILTPASS